MVEDEINTQARGNSAEWSFRYVAEMLPEFDPVQENIDVAQWIDKVEECGELYNWDETAIKHFGLSKLTGVARRWRDSLPREEKNWAAWEKLLLKNFPCERTALSLRLEAQNYKEKRTHNIIEYFYEKLFRCNETGIKSEETVEWMVHELTSKE